MTEITSEILFEKFELIECFKKDEHASVYLANHIYLGKRIILKVLNTKTIFDEAKIERFKREAKILAKLEDPNIIKVLDFGTFNEFFYISFEYFESRNLRAYIKDKSLSLEDKRQLVIQLFHGLSYAHQNQIIHRDIKPENILVNEKSELKIGDFGLALGLNDSFVTSQYSIVGTPCYMSPEQVQGGKLTIQSDLFSAGIVALELFTGKNPFLGDDVNKTISNLINYNEDVVEAYLITLPEELQNIIRKLLSKRPDKRYNNSEDVLKDLRVPLSEIKTNPSSVFKNRRIVFSVAALVLIILVGFFVFSSGETSMIKDDFTSSVGDEDKTSFNETISSQDDLVTDQTTPLEETNNESFIPMESTERVNAIENISDLREQLSESSTSISFGNLFVECIPWAHIYLDDRRLETTPISEAIDLKAGKYNIKLVHPDFPEYHQLVEIKPNQTTNIIINLDTLHGYLTCDVFPWGDVYLDDNFLGQTPFGEPIKLAPGSHVITIKNPNFPELVESIKITKRDTLILRYNLNDTFQNKLGSNN